MASEIDSISSGGDSGRDSSNEHVTPKKGHEFDNINVVVRVRPLHEKKHMMAERNKDQTSLFPAAGQIQVTDPQSNEDRLFTFNVVFEPEANQIDIFEYSGIKRLIDMSLEGFACTAFAYGQTGSGKTFTLSGNMNETLDSSYVTKNVNSNEKLKSKERVAGLIQLSFAYLFEQIKIKKQSNITYLVTASYLEVYNEQVLDLLNPSGKALQVRWNKHRGFYAENLFKVECEDVGDLQGVLEEGMKNRQFRAHEMNENSSRSHTLLTILLHCTSNDPEDNQDYITKLGRLCLVDLAGSEKTKRTKCTKETLTEANRINSSLLALGNCISALSSAKKRSGHIPYRDSTLTKLLADSLSGSGMTLMIACVSPSVSDAAETISTLRYAARAKKVKTNPIIRMDPREMLILSLKREVRLLRMENGYLRQQSNLGYGFISNLLPVPNNENSTNEKYFNARTSKSALSNHIYTQDSSQKQLKNFESTNAKISENNEFTSDSQQIVIKYMQENEGLRNENSQLHLQNEQVLLDLEQISRENERLKRRLEKQEDLIKEKVITNQVTNDLQDPNNGLSALNIKSSKLKSAILKDINNENKNNTFKIKRNSVFSLSSMMREVEKTNANPNESLNKTQVSSSSKEDNQLELKGVSAISHSRIAKK